MFSSFSSISKRKFSKKILSTVVAFAILIPGFLTPFLASADVTVSVTNTAGAIANYTVATSTDNIAISYSLPLGYSGTTTPTLDVIANILYSINTALVSAKANTSCSGSGTATANASATATIFLNSTTSVLAIAQASSSINCPPPLTQNTAPVITVLPPDPLELTLGSIFTDPGATAFDPEDKDITASIIKTGSVNTNATGTYTIFYNVKDTKGLAAVEKTRTVNVVASAPLVCALPLDVMLVIDRSGSMSDIDNPELPLSKAKAAATAFINTLGTATDRVGVVSYNEVATLNQALTSNFTAAKSSIASIAASGTTNIGDAFNKATLEMSTNSRPGAKHVIILLSDGLPNIPTDVASGTAYALAQATIAKTRGYVVYTIGLGDVNATLMKQLATTPSYYYFAPIAAELDVIYRAISTEECQRVPGTISGKKWHDREGNGIVNGYDVGIPDWEITLSSVTSSTTARLERTNPLGEFIFGDVFPDTYLLCESVKSGWMEITPATTTDNGCYRLQVTGGAQITGKNFLNSEMIKPQCFDQKDNDGDGKVDYPADTGCDSVTDNDENNPPAITVLGDNPLTLTIGGVFIDPGATAFDPEDKDITASIIKTDTVNTSTVGTYIITYNVKDTKGISAPMKTRTVIVASQCSDLKDNDGDGKIDMADAGCSNSNDNDENNQPIITILGANPLELTLGSTFIDPGATAFDPEDKDITASIIKTGSVNTNATGTYTIFYNVKDSKDLAAVEKTRTVKVNSVVTQCSDGIDNDGDTKIDYPADTGCDSVTDNDENNPPAITVLGDNPLTLTIGGVFIDPGATAFDPEDKDITASIIKTGSVNTSAVGTYTLAYNVKDTKGISAPTTIRTINIIPATCTANCGGGGGGSDNNRPVITLIGANTLTVIQGAAFVNPGATAFDPEDKDITAHIVLGGTVDTSRLGDYELTYNVSDSKGLPAMQVKRTVTVVPGVGGGGGGSATPITLYVFNEQIAVTGTTTVTITWNTNQPATSRVVYGLDSHSVLGVPQMYGYQLTTATDTALVTSHQVVLENIPSALATYYRPISTDGVRTAIGIELTRIPVVSVPAACFYLKEYLRLGMENNPVEVIKLQTFLNRYEGFTNLVVTGVFDITTDVAVRSFQDKYAVDVLVPWNLPTNTGYVYYTTQKKINEIYCKRSFPLTAAQLSEIAAFRELINKINAEGRESVPTLPIVGVKKGTSALAVAKTTGTVALVGKETIEAPIVPVEENIEGAVAGETIETTGAIASGASTTIMSEASRHRGRIALADLLAIMPVATSSLERRESSSSTEMNLDVTTSIKDTSPVVVSATTTKWGLAAVVKSISTKTKLSTWAVYVLSVLVFAFVVLLIMIARHYYVSQKKLVLN